MYRKYSKIINSEVVRFIVSVYIQHNRRRIKNDRMCKFELHGGLLSQAVGSKAARSFIVQNCRPTAGQIVPYFLVHACFIAK